MTIETATLLAVLAAPIAVLAVVAATAVTLLARRGRRGMLRSTVGLEQQVAAVRQGLLSSRVAIERTELAATALRARGRALDADLESWTTGLTAQRHTIERLNRSRLGPAVRAMQLAGALARVALLWRTPAR